MNNGDFPMWYRAVSALASVFGLMTVSRCNEKHTKINGDLTRGSDEFKDLHAKIDDCSKVINNVKGSVDTILSIAKDKW